MKYLKLLIFVLLINSCVQVEKRGYSFELSDYKVLREGVHSKEDVLNSMGYPSFFSQIENQESWVYIHEDAQKLMFFKHKILDRQIVTIYFNNQNIIKEIKNYDLNDQEDIAFKSGYTHVASPKKSWWSRIFGNIGQVRAVN